MAAKSASQWSSDRSRRDEVPWYMPQAVAVLSEAVQDRRDLVLSEDYVHPYPSIHALVQSTLFRTMSVVVILANCAFIAWQSSSKDGGAEVLHSFFIYLEYFFTAFFMIELVLRYLERGWIWWFDRGNFGDAFVVFICGGLVVFVLVPFAGLDSLAVLRKLTVLRAIRLFQALNYISKREELKELAMLIHGLMHSMRVLLWVAVMVTFLLYVFAVFATELIAKDESFRYDPLAQEHFGDVTLSMFSLFQILTLDRWSQIVRPLAEKQTWTTFFFLLFIFVAYFLVVNLVTAIMVEQAFAFMRQDEEEKWREREKGKHLELDHLKSIFEDLDEDGNGRLTREELEASRRHPKIQKRLRGLEISAKEIDELWEILDDGDGELTIDEFVNGMKKMKGVAQARDTMYVMRNLKDVDMDISGLDERLDKMSEEVTFVKSEVREVHRSMGLLLRVCKKLEASDSGGGHLPALPPPAAPIKKEERSKRIRLPAIENVGRAAQVPGDVEGSRSPPLLLPGVPSRDALRSADPVVTEVTEGLHKASPKLSPKTRPEDSGAEERGGVPARPSVKFVDPGPPKSPPPIGVPKPEVRRPSA